MVATGTIEVLKQSAARTVTVDFSLPVEGQPPLLPGVTLRSRSACQWVLDVRSPMGPLIVALSSYPVLDIDVEPFKLEDYVARHYSEPS
jgi:hypothetical protein